MIFRVSKARKGLSSSTSPRLRWPSNSFITGSTSVGDGVHLVGRPFGVLHEQGLRVADVLGGVGEVAQEPFGVLQQRLALGKRTGRAAGNRPELISSAASSHSSSWCSAGWPCSEPTSAETSLPSAKRSSPLRLRPLDQHHAGLAQAHHRTDDEQQAVFGQRCRSGRRCHRFRRWPPADQQLGGGDDVANVARAAAGNWWPPVDGAGRPATRRAAASTSRGMLRSSSDAAACRSSDHPSSSVPRRTTTSTSGRG